MRYRCIDLSRAAVDFWQPTIESRACVCVCVFTGATMKGQAHEDMYDRIGTRRSENKTKNDKTHTHTHARPRNCVDQSEKTE